MQRVVVVGTSGSGKSVIGVQLAALIDAPAIDIDTLYWEPNWQPTSADVFNARVEAAIAQERWVISGNYSRVRDLIWSAADTLVWLDYPLPVIYWRLLRRTLRRILTREDLWGTGNRETWRAQFFSRDSLFLWVLKSRPRQRREYPQLFKTPAFQHLHVIHLHSPREADAWLMRVKDMMIPEKH